MSFIIRVTIITAQLTIHEMVMLILYCTGPRLHYCCAARADAERVWQGRQEERADQEPGPDLRAVAARAPNLPR